MKNTFHILSFLLLLSACKPDDNQPNNINVNEVFEPYVEKFIDAGQARGIDVDFSDTGLSIQFGNITDAAASCSEIAGHDSGSHQILVNRNAWEVLNDSLRERLIFHELGHCELNRPHRNDKFNDGSWKSIMRGDPLGDGDNLLPIPYFGFRKAYYLDELFDEAIPEPDWADLEFDYADIGPDDKIILLQRIDINTINDTVDLDLTNYELEFELRTLSSDNQTWIAWGESDRHYFFWFQENQFHFSANSSFQGPLHFVKDENLDVQQTQKVTIRQQGAFCKIFLNEQFFFLVDRLPADLFFVLSSDENQIEIESFTLSEL